MEDRVRHVVEILEDRPSEAALSWLARGFRASITEPDPLPVFRALGLPGTAASIRRDVRDYHLRAAVHLLDGDHRALMAYAQRFTGFQWAAWQRLAGPPPEATELEKVLFKAFRAEYRMPSSEKQWKSICGKTSSGRLQD